MFELYNEIELFIVDLFCLCLNFLLLFGVYMLFVRERALHFNAPAETMRALYFTAAAGASVAHRVKPGDRRTVN